MGGLGDNSKLKTQLLLLYSFPFTHGAEDRARVQWVCGAIGFSGRSTTLKERRPLYY